MKKALVVIWWIIWDKPSACMQVAQLFEFKMRPTIRLWPAVSIRTNAVFEVTYP